MVLAGSLGVGWLASISPLRQNPLIIWMRYETGGVVLSILLLAIGSMIMVREWLRLGQKLNKWGDGTGKWVLTAITAWSVPLLFAVPLFSRDVYSYIGQGRVMQSGLNPYENGVSTIENFFQLGADQLWAESPPPTGRVPVARTTRRDGHERESGRLGPAVSGHVRSFGDRLHVGDSSAGAAARRESSSCLWLSVAIHCFSPTSSRPYTTTPSWWPSPCSASTRQPSNATGRAG
ncbi:polyprenol phosphomannose-dependent alpha 1,6 mannosyltransferase MptB [Kocuria atrinae]|uniref:polyprenol phosphomannose-dependent alpha 1,6 mannosyltransferase MptB n=1 Tax=Kocuria atrinae TaxID=592377 RepID=UPI002942F7F9|nr:polyprenol phosphomannose-dependent alpha 1,6 mannosyltransferase MptB [Kocuria atrinae]